MLASLEDIRKWLPEDKLPVNNVSVSGFQIEAQRIIKGALSGVFKPTTLFAWNAPDTTPETIRAIAGKLIAAFVYREAYSEDVPDVPQYAQTLYNEAVGELQQVRAGTMQILDANGDPIESNTLDMTSGDFLPNDATTPGPIFTMGMEFA